MKPTFKLPETKMCVVVWARNGKVSEQLIDTLRSNDALINLMLMAHHVGYSEIRAVKSVDVRELLSRKGW